MQELRKISRIELGAVVLTVILLTGWRLFMEIMHYSSMLTMDQNAHYESLTSYNFWLNTVFPLVARAILLLEAWYIFHYIVYPKIKSGDFREKDIWYLVLAIVCTASGVFLYYYFKVSVSTDINYNVITDIRTESLYRKLTVFSDTVGMLVVFCLYEGLAHLYSYLYERLGREKEFILKAAGYLVLANVVAFLIFFITIVPFRTPLWEGPTANFLFYSGISIQVYLLQHYFYRQVIPSIQTKNFPRFSIYLFVGFLLVFGGCIVIWICYRNFRWPFEYIEPVSILVVIIFFLSAIIAYTRHTLFQEKTILQTQVSASSAELAGLRSQINPHFLFNALNSLYATALKEKSDKTADGIQKLGDMMRFMLEENNQERIPLGKEVEYLHNYIDLQRLRIDESQGVEIRVNIQQPERDIYIAPMMLNPFVENAFKHGVSLQHPSWIYITLTMDAARVYFKVHNSLHGRKEEDPEENSTGVGLANVRKRLELLYPGRHTLDIQQSDKDFFVSLTLVYQANQTRKQVQDAVTS